MVQISNIDSDKMFQNVLDLQNRSYCNVIDLDNMFNAST